MAMATVSSTVPGIMDEFRPLLEALYYDPDNYDTYLDQLGIDYPKLEPDAIGRGQ